MLLILIHDTARKELCGFFIVASTINSHFSIYSTDPKLPRNIAKQLSVEDWKERVTVKRGCNSNTVCVKHKLPHATSNCVTKDTEWRDVLNNTYMTPDKV